MTLSADELVNSSGVFGGDGGVGLSYYDCLLINFRTNTAGGNCYTSGYVREGEFTFQSQVHCQNYAPLQAWFNLKVKVTAGENTVDVFIDGVQVISPDPMHFPPRASGGIVVPNGYGNIVRYKNIQVIQTPNP